MTASAGSRALCRVWSIAGRFSAGLSDIDKSMSCASQAQHGSTRRSVRNTDAEMKADIGRVVEVDDVFRHREGVMQRARLVADAGAELVRVSGELRVR